MLNKQFLNRMTNIFLEADDDPVETEDYRMDDDTKNIEDEEDINEENNTESEEENKEDEEPQVNEEDEDLESDDYSMDENDTEMSEEGEEETDGGELETEGEEEDSSEVYKKYILLKKYKEIILDIERLELSLVNLKSNLDRDLADHHHFITKKLVDLKNKISFLILNEFEKQPYSSLLTTFLYLRKELEEILELINNLIKHNDA